MPTSLAGYLDFLRNVVGISTTVLPDDSPYITLTYNVAVEEVYWLISAVAPFTYQMALYNFATNFLINVCPDQPDQTYFAGLRHTFGLLNFKVGPIVSTSDVSTSEGMFVADFFKNMNLAELALLGTPYGRAYLGIAQQMGTLWGIS